MNVNYYCNALKISDWLKFCDARYSSTYNECVKLNTVFNSLNSFRLNIIHLAINLYQKWKATQFIKCFLIFLKMTEKTKLNELLTWVNRFLRIRDEVHIRSIYISKMQYPPIIYGPIITTSSKILTDPTYAWYSKTRLFLRGYRQREEARGSYREGGQS